MSHFWAFWTPQAISIGRTMSHTKGNILLPTASISPTLKGKPEGIASVLALSAEADVFLPEAGNKSAESPESNKLPAFA